MGERERALMGWKMTFPLCMLEKERERREEDGR